MMRMLRVIGIIVFAIMLSISARSLWKMQAVGNLFDSYNSSRKASVTLCAVSLLALAALVSFETRRLGKSTGIRRFGEKRYTDELEESKVANASSIYASPKSVDEWQGRKVVASRSRNGRNKAARNLPGTCRCVLRISCLILPLAYVALFSLLYAHEAAGPSLGAWIYVLPCACLVLVAAITEVGVCMNKRWGLSMGYLLSILNLVIFPLGTAIGLLLLITLVMASPAFESSRARRKVRAFV